MPQRPEDEEAAADERNNGRYWQEKAQDDRTGRSASAERIRNQTHWVDLQVRRAMERVAAEAPTP